MHNYYILQVNKKNTMRGNALITALLMLALIAITSTSLMQRVHLETMHTQSFTQAVQLRLYSDLVTFWAMDLLEKKIPKALDTEQPYILDIFPKQLSEAYPGYILSGEILDAQAKLNINSIIQDPMQPVFLNILKKVKPQSSITINQAILAAVLDWITPATNKTADKWSQYYLSLPEPYIQAHQPIQAIEELNRIAGIKTIVLTKLLPYIVALPEPTKINLNTAPLQLLESISEQETDAESFLAWRSNHSETITDNDLQDIITNFHFDPNTICLQSQYFLINARVQHLQRTYVVQSLVHLETTEDLQASSKSKPIKKVHLIWQQLRL